LEFNCARGVRREGRKQTGRELAPMVPAQVCPKLWQSITSRRYLLPRYRQGNY
jgi:hypothetical protein